MKKVFFAITFVAISLASCKKDKKKVEAKEAVKVEKKAEIEGNVNVTTSVIEWKGTKPTGFHNGTVNISTGSLNVEKDSIKSGEFIIDMKSIKCLDIPADDEGNQKLVGHLNGVDFFDVDNNPTAKFVIAEAKEKEGKLQVTGNLTLRGTTKSITFPATFAKTDDGYSLTSDAFKVDRTQFGITYKSKTIDAALKDKFIDDLMEFTVKIYTKK